VKLEPVEDPEDPRIADYRGVRDPAWLAQRGVFLVEGHVPLGIAVAEPRFRLRSVLVTATALERLPPLPTATPVYRVSRAALAAVSGVRFHQGCVAAAELAADLPGSECIDTAPGDGPVVVLEGVTNPDNVGAVFRNGLAFGARAVLLDARSASPLYRKAIRTSLGATLRVPFGRVEEGARCLSALRERGFRTAALTPDASALSLSDFVAAAEPDRVAWVLGNEGAGLSDALLEAADVRVRIPMSAGADSLNLATAAAIALEHLFRAASG